MHYRLHFFDPDGTLATTLELGCTDDRRALALLADVEARYTMELWQNERLVKRLELGTETA